MDLYDTIAYRFAKQLTLSYASSFGLGSRLIAPGLRRHIYAVYGLVRIADEIVDTYQGGGQARLLDELETETYQAIDSGYSANPLVHSFALSARRYGIDRQLIQPFFRSMRLDLEDISYTTQLYDEYIYGSAEVVGLMCLKVFCEGNRELYEQLAPGAQALGKAFQKVNFLRDIGSDHRDRQRMYFPGYSYNTFDDKAKSAIVRDARVDFEAARPAINELPDSCRRAVLVSYKIYSRLLDRLGQAPIDVIKSRRLRIGTSTKLRLLSSALVKGRA